MVDFMLDPGHDEYTPGKGVAGLKEFHFNRAVVEKMIIMLKVYEGVKVSISHDMYDGIDQTLKQRTDLANRLGVNCFLSVHANAASSAAANGIETFVHPRAPQSTVNLGAVIQGELIRLTGMNNRGIKKSDFHVLRETRMDAVLVECGFMTHAGDLAKLKSDDFRGKCAQAIINGLAKHYGLKKKAVSVKPAPIKEEEDMLEKAIVIGGFPDFAVAEILAARLKAPVYTRAALPGGKIAKEAYVVGGSITGILADKVISLSGADRFAVAAAVKKFLG
jgi:N-acetylmuramoyl-L-alanine amidase